MRTLRTIHGEFQHILDLVESEKRQLSDAEESQLEALNEEFDVLAKSLGVDQIGGRKAGPQPVHGNPQPAFSGVGAKIPESVPLFKNVVSGELVNGFRGTAPMAPENDYPLGDAIHAIALNDFSNLSDSLSNSLTVGSDSGGGYLAPPAMSERVLDLSRAQSVVMRAGAISVPMQSSELVLTQLTGDPSVAWRGETGTVTGSKPTFGRLTLRPRTLAAIVPVSMELLEDSANAAQIIESSLTSALGVELDRVLLEGVGAGHEPLGVVHTDGVNTQASIGTPTSYAEVSTAIRDILNANFAGEISDLSWIQNPVIAGTYDQLATGISGDLTPLPPTPWVQQLRRLHTTNLQGEGSPLGYNMIVGSFSELLVGARTSGVVIDVLDAGTLTDEDNESWNAATQFLRFIRARIRIDCVVMRPAFFSVLSGVNS